MSQIKRRSFSSVAGPAQPGPRPVAPALTAAPLDYTYDNSWEGLLTVLFAIYDAGQHPTPFSPKAGRRAACLPCPC
jgi:hypothetical protein